MPPILAISSTQIGGSVEATPEFLAFQPDAFSMASSNGRAAMDTVISAVCHGMLTRHPEVKMATVELGSTWLPRVVEDLLLTYKKVPQQFAEHPLETIKRQLWVTPFWEDPIQPVIDIIGLDHVLYSSDWPHPEGLADPVGYYKFCEQEGLPGQRDKEDHGHQHV